MFSLAPVCGSSTGVSTGVVVAGGVTTGGVTTGGVTTGGVTTGGTVTVTTAALQPCCGLSFAVLLPVKQAVFWIEPSVLDTTFTRYSFVTFAPGLIRPMFSVITRCDGVLTSSTPVGSVSVMTV